MIIESQIHQNIRSKSVVNVQKSENIFNKNDDMEEEKI